MNERPPALYRQATALVRVALLVLAVKYRHLAGREYDQTYTPAGFRSLVHSDQHIADNRYPRTINLHRRSLNDTQSRVVIHANPLRNATPLSHEITITPIATLSEFPWV